MTNRIPHKPRSSFLDRADTSSDACYSGYPERSETRRSSEIRIAGGPAVDALFRYDPDRVLRFFYTESKSRNVGDYCRELAQRRLPYRMVPDNELEKIYGSSHHGGLVAIANPKREQILTRYTLSQLKALGPVHFVLDGIGNPHNIGAIARSLAFFGFKSLILSDDARQAGLSDSAYRVAEGGLEALTIFKAEGLQNLLEEARKIFRITGTTLSRQAQSLRTLTEKPGPRLILLGNEEEGLSGQRLRACDDLLMISGTGDLQSLNVAQTAAILAYGFQTHPRVSKPTSDSSLRGHPRVSGDSRKAGTPRREESKNTPKALAPRAAPQKKPHSPKGSRPGTKTPSR